MEDRYRQRIIERLDKQRKKGVKKYGGTLETNKAGMLERLEHLAQELTDGLEYIEWIKELVGGQALETEPTCFIRPHTVCYNEKCWKYHAYRTECWSNYFCHHRGEPEREETCSSCGHYYKNVGQDIEVQCCSVNGTDVACEKWKPQIVERRCETCRFYSPTLIGNCDYIIPIERECKNNYLSRWEAK